MGNRPSVGGVKFCVRKKFDALKELNSKFVRAIRVNEALHRCNEPYEA
jgi:hypothetical protein